MVGPLDFNANTSGLAFDPETGTLYPTEANTDALHTVNTETGLATEVGSLGVANILGLTFVAGAVSREPAITSITHEQTTTTVTFSGLSEVEYVLLKSLDLDFSDFNVVDQVTLNDNVGLLIDDTAEEESAFYRVSILQ